MTGLIGAHIRSNWALWSGLLMVAISCGFVGEIALCSFSISRLTEGDDAVLLLNSSSMIATFSVLAGIPVCFAVIGALGSLQRKSFALWRLCGIRSFFVGLLFSSQVFVVSLAGALMGSIIAAVAYPLIHPALFESFLNVSRLPVEVDPLSVFPVALATSMVAAVTSVKTAIQVSKVSPLDALKEREGQPERLPFYRWLLFGLPLLVVTALLMAMACSDLYFRVTVGSFMPLFVVGSLAFVMPCLLRGAFSLIRRLSSQVKNDCWFLASSAAQFKLRSSSAIESPFSICIGVVCGFFAVQNVLSLYLGDLGLSGSNTLGITQVAVMLGPPCLLCASGIAAGMIMLSRSKARDIALLRLSGSCNGTMVLSSALEAVLHVVNATLVGLFASFISVFFTALSCGVALKLTPGCFVPVEGAIVILLGLFFLVLVASCPTISLLIKDDPVGALCEGAAR